MRCVVGDTEGWEGRKEGRTEEEREAHTSVGDVMDNSIGMSLESRPRA